MKIIIYTSLDLRPDKSFMYESEETFEPTITNLMYFFKNARKKNYHIKGKVFYMWVDGKTFALYRLKNNDFVVYPFGE